MLTNISQIIDITHASAKYDASIKEMLADKQVLARILKYTLDEFSSMSIEAIINSIGEPLISSMRMEPGHTNTEKIQKLSEEDNVLGEGKIYYDIRFSAYCGEELIKVLVNVEAQKSTNPSKLGYHLDNRILYYLGRMISAQKEVEFAKSKYDDLKAVRSIWICMDTTDGKESINRIKLTQDTLFGKDMELPNINKIQGVIIRLRSNKKVGASKNQLIAMLEELLRYDSAESKRNKLEKFGFVINTDTERRINTMCNLSSNLSEIMLEQGWEQGRDEGRAEGEERILKLYDYLVEKGLLEEMRKARVDSIYRENLLKSLGL